MIKFKTLSNILLLSLLQSIPSQDVTFACDQVHQEKRDSLSLTSQQLKTGYELTCKGGCLRLEDSTRWQVTNACEEGSPNFEMATWLFEDYNGISILLNGIDKKNTGVFNFIFNYAMPPMYENEEMQREEIGTSVPGSFCEVFNLNVTRIPDSTSCVIESNSTLSTIQGKESISNNDASLPSTSNSDSLNQSNDASLPSTSNSDSLNQSIAENISSFKIIKEPNTFEVSDNSFYIEHKARRNIWIVTERITPDNVWWWKQRLGVDAYIQFSRKCQIERKRALLASEEDSQQVSQGQSEFDQGNSLIRDPQLISLLPSWVEEAEKFMGPDYLKSDTEELTQLLDRDDEFLFFANNAYLSAWRGFDYNLNNHHKAPTYASCILSQPLEGKSITALSPLSPYVQMLMTSTLSESFYSPLGIYASPLARLHNHVNKLANYKNLSLSLHAATACAVSEINPSTKYMVVRPLQSMATIIKNSGISFSESVGNRQDINIPYIRSLQPINHQWYSSKIKLEKEEREQFGDSLFTLIDPRLNTFYQIGDDHPFSQSPFLGGTDREQIEAFPFFTIDVENLKKF